MLHFGRHANEGAIAMGTYLNSFLKMDSFLNNDSKDKGIDDLTTITSPDDLFKREVDIDLKKLDYVPLKIN